MEILTTQDFNQIPYNVPNAQAQTPGGGTEENAQFAFYINDKVAGILLKLLGVSLYESFIAGLEALPDEWKSDAIYIMDDEVLFNYHVWKSLTDINSNNEPVEGTEWTMIPDNQWLMLYNGSKYGTNSVWVGMKKMLTPYIYAFWLRDTYDDHTKNGIVRRNAENAIIIDPAKRISRAYNQFSLYAGNYCNQKNTLYGYLLWANSQGHFDGSYDNVNYDLFTDYLRCSFNYPGNMNQFNI